MTIPAELLEPPVGADVAPPITPSVHDLPFGSIPWENFERLCLRLVQRREEVDDAHYFGTRGQFQSGIDIYSHDDSGQVSVYQCRRVQTLTGTGLENAVQDFLRYEWADRAHRFVVCTSISLAATQLVRTVADLAAKLAARDRPIRFAVWDSEAIAMRLRDYPDLIREFFGPYWLAAFAPEVVERITAGELADLRRVVEQVRGAVTRRPIFVFDWNPGTARRELGQLAESDPELAARLSERVGNPPEPSKVRHLVQDEPDWLTAADSRAWRVLGLLAENSGDWETATSIWRSAADRAVGDERSGFLVAAAVTADLLGDHAAHDALLEQARQLSPSHPRVVLQDIDQNSDADTRLRQLDGLTSDDDAVAALIASHRVLAYLLKSDMPQARHWLAEGLALNPTSATVRMMRINVAVQQGRLDALVHRRLNLTELEDALEEAGTLRRNLLDHRRYAESMRVLMLNSDALMLLAEHERARRLLATVTPQELEVADSGEVLGDAAIRALGWKEALLFTEHSPASPEIERIRACATYEIGTPPERKHALAALDKLVAEAGHMAEMAALFRLAASLGSRQVPWSQDAAELLIARGHEEAELTARAFMEARRGYSARSGYTLLAPHGTEVWALVAKLRIAVNFRDATAIRATVASLLNLAPAQDVLVEAAQALSVAGERVQSREILIGVARDRACPKAIRANAYALLIPLLADAGEWGQAGAFHAEWVDVRAEDARLAPWAPRIANRNRAQQ